MCELLRSFSNSFHGKNYFYPQTVIKNFAYLNLAIAHIYIHFLNKCKACIFRDNFLRCFYIGQLYPFVRNDTDFSNNVYFSCANGKQTKRDAAVK